MPKEYIARLVLDRRHRSVAIVRTQNNVVGGITYRPFHEQSFGEIAFCAVTASEQVKGFVTRLMKHTMGSSLYCLSVHIKVHAALPLPTMPASRSRGLACA